MAGGAAEGVGRRLERTGTGGAPPCGRGVRRGDSWRRRSSGTSAVAPTSLNGRTPNSGTRRRPRKYWPGCGSASRRLGWIPDRRPPSVTTSAANRRTGPPHGFRPGRCFAEVVLGELARQSLDVHHHHRGGMRTQLGDQLIERTLAALVAVMACPPLDLDRFQRCVSLLVDLLHQLCTKARIGATLLGRPIPRTVSSRQLSTCPTAGSANDAPHASYRHSGELCDLDLVVAGSEQGLDLMPFQ